MSLSEYVRREDLMQLFHLSMKDAAKRLNVSESSLRNICRKHNIGRWPFRKFQQLDAHLSALTSDLAKLEKQLQTEAELDFNPIRSEGQPADTLSHASYSKKSSTLLEERSKTREMVDSLNTARSVLEQNPNLSLEMAIIEANKQNMRTGRQRHTEGAQSSRLRKTSKRSAEHPERRNVSPRQSSFVIPPSQQTNGSHTFELSVTSPSPSTKPISAATAFGHFNWNARKQAKSEKHSKEEPDQQMAQQQLSRVEPTTVSSPHMMDSSSSPHVSPRRPHEFNDTASAMHHNHGHGLPAYTAHPSQPIAFHVNTINSHHGAHLPMHYHHHHHYNHHQPLISHAHHYQPYPSPHVLSPVPAQRFSPDGFAHVTTTIPQLNISPRNKAFNSSSAMVGSPLPLGSYYSPRTVASSPRSQGSDTPLAKNESDLLKLHYDNSPRIEPLYTHSPPSALPSHAASFTHHSLQSISPMQPYIPHATMQSHFVHNNNNNNTPHPATTIIQQQQGMYGHPSLVQHQLQHQLKQGHSHGSANFSGGKQFNLAAPSPSTAAHVNSCQ